MVCRQVSCAGQAGEDDLVRLGQTCHKYGAIVYTVLAERMKGLLVSKTRLGTKLASWYLHHREGA